MRRVNVPVADVIPRQNYPEILEIIITLNETSVTYRKKAKLSMTWTSPKNI